MCENVSIGFNQLFYEKELIFFCDYWEENLLSMSDCDYLKQLF